MLSLIILVASGCATGDNQGLSAKGTGKTVPENKRIELLDGGPHQNRWQSRDLTLTYEYTRQSGKLGISGQVTFKRAKRLERFGLEANLIDAEGKVLLQQQIAYAGGRRQYETVPFESELSAPEGTWGVAFSYSGVTRGVGEGAGSPNSFWQTPF
jgi:hypothetical protein